MALPIVCDVSMSGRGKEAGGGALWSRVPTEDQDEGEGVVIDIGVAHGGKNGYGALSGDAGGAGAAAIGIAHGGKNGYGALSGDAGAAAAVGGDEDPVLKKYRELIEIAQHNYDHYESDEEEYEVEPPSTFHPVKLFSMEHAAIPLSYFTIGFLGSFIRTPLNVFMVNQMGLQPADQNTIQVLCSIPWSFKILHGFLSDVYPICGLKRKPYLLIGYGTHVLCYSILTVLVYYETVTHSSLAFLLFFATVGQIMADVMSDTLVVERSRDIREAEAARDQKIFEALAKSPAMPSRRNSKGGGGSMGVSREARGDSLGPAGRWKLVRNNSEGGGGGGGIGGSGSGSGYASDGSEKGALLDAQRQQAMLKLRNGGSSSSYGGVNGSKAGGGGGSPSPYTSAAHRKTLSNGGGGGGGISGIRRNLSPSPSQTSTLPTTTSSPSAFSPASMSSSINSSSRREDTAVEVAEVTTPGGTVRTPGGTKKGVVHKSSDGQLQGSCYAIRFIGSVAGCFGGAVLFNYRQWGWGLTFHQVCFVVAITPVLILATPIWTLHEDVIEDSKSIKKQCKDVWATIKLKAVWKPMAFVYVFNLFQIPNAAWSSFLQLGLHFQPYQLGFMATAGAITTFIGVMAYKKYLFHVSWRLVYLWSVVITTIFSLLQLFLIFRLNITWLHMGDFWFALGDDVITEYVQGIQFLPLVVMYMQLCPGGSEGATYSMLTTFGNIALVVAGSLGTVVSGIWDVSNQAMRDHNYNGLWKLTVLTSVISPIPLALIGLLPATQVHQESLKSDKESSRVGGAVFLFVLVVSLWWVISEAVQVVMGNDDGDVPGHHRGGDEDDY